MIFLSLNCFEMTVGTDFGFRQRGGRNEIRRLYWDHITSNGNLKHQVQYQARNAIGLEGCRNVMIWGNNTY